MRRLLTDERGSIETRTPLMIIGVVFAIALWNFTKIAPEKVAGVPLFVKVLVCAIPVLFVVGGFFLGDPGHGLGTMGRLAEKERLRAEEKQRAKESRAAASSPAPPDDPPKN